MSCVTHHEHVVASGTCAACGLPVQLTGPLPPLGNDHDGQGEGLLWLAPPFGDLDASAICRATGDLHTVEHAVGACCGCSALLEAVGTTDGETWWFEA
jgi:hypothetical protein